MDRSVPVVHMIGNAHIDPVWLWSMAEGREEVLSTYRTAIALIETFEGYVFTSGGAATYQWVQEDDPALFAAIHKAVQVGRWALVSGWWLQPDCNLPGGESFARHALYGQRWLEAHLGQRARVGYNVDSFGHAATLPQLLRLGGLESYVFFRPGPHEMDLPAEPFWWEAPGGARVLAYRPPLHYNSPEREHMAERVAAAVAQAPHDLPAILCFYGVGNHGGGPTRHNVQALVDLAAQGDAPGSPVFSSPERYFSEVQALGRKWPVVASELQHHARGCYSVLSRVKRENRQAEQALLRAERLAAIAGTLPADDGALEEAWRGVLFSQFHDVLAGTSIRGAYEDVWALYAAAMRTAEQVQDRALRVLSQGAAVADLAQSVIVWNPLAWERTEPVRLAMTMGGFRDAQHRRGTLYPGTPTMVDAQGQPVPCQLMEVELDYSTYTAHLEALVTVPALGFGVFYVTIPETDPPTADPVSPPAHVLENGHLRLELDPETGWIRSLADRASGTEFLDGPAGVPIVLDDPSDTWSHGVDAYRDEVGRFQAVRPPERVTSGPVRDMLRVEQAWGASTIVQEFSLLPDSREVDVRVTVDWHEQFRVLKLAFPLRLANATVVASAPYGHTARETNGEEEPCQAWVDLSGEQDGGTAGVTLLNDGKYAYDAFGAELRLTVLRSPIYAFHVPRQVVPGVTYHYIDQGVQSFAYRLRPHLGPWQRARPDRAAMELHEPLIGRAVSPQSGGRESGSFLRVEPEHLVLTVARRGADGTLIVRGYEAAGRAAEMTITSDLWGLSWRHSVAAYEVWTLRLPSEGGSPQALSFLEEPL